MLQMKEMKYMWDFSFQLPSSNNIYVQLLLYDTYSNIILPRVMSLKLKSE